MELIDVLLYVLIIGILVYLSYFIGWNNGFKTHEKITEQIDKKMIVQRISEYLNSCKENTDGSNNK